MKSADPTPVPDERARAILGEAYAQYSREVLDLARTAIETATDLFEMSDYVSPSESQAFLDRRGDWLKRFEIVLGDLYAKRMAGERRRGKRPDFDASLASLRVLTAFDHEKQAALASSTAFLLRFTKREVDALDLRVSEVLGERPGRELDNPFSPLYLLDAIGVSSRAVYPVSKLWRPLMERLVADLTPSSNKLYIHANRLLADRGVLPDIKASLRAKSSLWPQDDRDLLPAFSRLMSEAGPMPTDIVVPPAFADPSAPPALNFADQLPSQLAAMPRGAGPARPPGGVTVSPETAAAMANAPQVMAGLSALSRLAAQVPQSAGGAVPTAAPGDLPNLDPLMALGANSPLFNLLAQWQRIDLPAAIANAAPRSNDGEKVAVPQNLVPYIRLAIADQLEHETDRISMDVIAMLFDYVFRDPSIPDRLRDLFGRLQVPVVKVGLLDRAFFSERAHPARKMLDHLAAAAIGATGDARYYESFRRLALSIVDDLCFRFEIDVAVFAEADRKLTAFIESERRSTETAVAPDVSEAGAIEAREEDRTAAAVAVRNKLTGIEVPFEVRSFLETTWVDHLAGLRKREGAESEGLARAHKVVDDLLWSITAKERAAQKTRLTKMVPALIAGLRAGSQAVAAPVERTRPFFESLYVLHMAAIKPVIAQANAAAAAPAAPPTHGLPAAVNVHDFVADMVLGTWLAFETADEHVNARLHWISPLRTRYVFTSRLRAKAFVFTPEELAWQLGSGKAALVMEPVPLFDRAVSAALDRIAAQKPAAIAA